MKETKSNELSVSARSLSFLSSSPAFSTVVNAGGTYLPGAIRPMPPGFKSGRGGGVMEHAKALRGPPRVIKLCKANTGASFYDESATDCSEKRVQRARRKRR